MGNGVIEHAESKFDVKNMLYTINKHGLFIAKCFCSIVSQPANNSGPEQI